MRKLRKIWAVLMLCFILAGCGAEDKAAGGQEEALQNEADENSQEAASQAEEDGAEAESIGEEDGASRKARAAAEDTAGDFGAASGQEDDPEEVTYIDIPLYTKDAYTVVNDNIPYFSDDELTDVSFEYYAELDSLGRCGACMASVGLDIMPTKERENIGSVKPTGWHTVKYDGVVDGNYLYNRCHLLGFQLTGENANEKNLITGTRYMNVEGMLPFENMVADYVKETGNHVMYRVTPLFDGDNLVADGVLMEAKSVEDNGEDILFNVFCYNVQPGVLIDYATGESVLDEKPAAQAESGAYAVNGGNGKIHITGKCPATGDSDMAMTDPIYFDSYEEAEERSVLIDPNMENRNCGNCW